MDDGLHCRAVRELPPCFQQVFKAFRYFNAVQSDVYHQAYNEDINMVVAAPTGSGKTAVLELAILGMLKKHLSADGCTLNINPGRLKALYVAPIRALVQEKAREWQERFGPLGLKCQELTGDAALSSGDLVAQLDVADIIATTPEKFDATTRSRQGAGGTQFFSDIALVLIDEVHTLGENRGTTLEAGVVSRIHMIGSLPGMGNHPISSARFIAVSATVPNASDLAGWLRVPPQGLKVYGDELRPCKLMTHVKGFNPAKNDFLFERRLSNYLLDQLLQFSSGKPALVFCSSRKGTAESAQALLKSAAGRGHSFLKNAAQSQTLQAAAGRLRNKQLQQLVPAGVAFHHAALEPQDRDAVEQLFRSQTLLALCCTSTLAQGVNLPAHLVILKGTRRYCGSQMIGRAGRPGYDLEGVAVIMTQREQVARYQSLLLGTEEVESQLSSSMAEHINAEVVLRTITSVEQAIAWLKTSFLWIRAHRKPQAYALTGGTTTAAAGSVETLLKDRMVLGNVRELVKFGMVELDLEGRQLTPLEPGRLMACHYISWETMKLICGIVDHPGVFDLLEIIAAARELQHIPLRRGEKSALNSINNPRGGRAPPKYYVPDEKHPGRPKQRIATRIEKIIVLMNEALGPQQEEVLDYQMRQEQDQSLAQKEGESVVGLGVDANALISESCRYCAFKRTLSGAANALVLEKSIKAKVWEGIGMDCRQLPQVGRQAVSRLSAAGITSLQELVAADPRKIESLCQRNYPFEPM